MLGLLRHHSGQEVLGGEIPPHIGVALPHADADDRPVIVEPALAQLVEIGGLTGAADIADADMGDAGAQLLCPAVRSADRWPELPERRAGQA
jgi:hypothetical protein